MGGMRGCLGAMQPATVVPALATATGALSIITHSLAPADPVPRRIDSALVGDAAAHLGEVDAAERVELPVEEGWGILALEVLAAGAFAELASFGTGRCAVLPTFLFFLVLGNVSSGGAVPPALLPQPFAFLSQWLPTDATVTALRNAVHYRHHQHPYPLLVLPAWAVALFAAWVVVVRQRRAT